MTDLTLHDGREIAFDLYSFTFTEYMEIFGEGNEEKADALIARSINLTVEDFKALPYPDNRKVVNLFFKKCREVTENPNSASASS